MERVISRAGRAAPGFCWMGGDETVGSGQWWRTGFLCVSRRPLGAACAGVGAPPSRREVGPAGLGVFV